MDEGGIEVKGGLRPGTHQHRTKPNSLKHPSCVMTRATIFFSRFFIDIQTDLYYFITPPPPPLYKSGYDERFFY